MKKKLGANCTLCLCDGMVCLVVGIGTGDSKHWSCDQSAWESFRCFHIYIPWVVYDEMRINIKFPIYCQSTTTICCFQYNISGAWRVDVWHCFRGGNQRSNRREIAEKMSQKNIFDAVMILIGIKVIK